MAGRIRSVVVVTADPVLPKVIETLIGDSNDYGVIFVESMDCAYSQIRQIMPDIVVVFCEIDDPSAWQLVSMLKIDPALGRVRIVTHASPPASFGVERVQWDVPRHSWSSR
jgi:hypothetical protein